MTDPAEQSGDRAPAGRLDRPPSDRYATRGPGPTGPEDRPRSGASRSALGPPVLAGLVTATVLVIVGGVLALHSGLFFLAGLGGWAIGLLVARGAVSTDGATQPLWSRREATQIAAGLALATVLAAALGTWVVSRVEGGVMDPVAYLWETMGPLLPAEAVVAMLAAAWGANAGPIRWRA